MYAYDSSDGNTLHKHKCRLRELDDGQNGGGGGPNIRLVEVEHHDGGEVIQHPSGKRLQQISTH